MMSQTTLKSLLLAGTALLVPAFALAQAAPEPASSPASSPDTAAPAEEEPDEVVVVRGRFIPEPMRQTSEVATFLSGADLARAGDDTAAAALTRLTGLSVVSERFVFVRGLGDRYSSALLNGSPLPSPEPLRRQVPLDLFPSNILDGAAVQKTFSPNYPGEFGGGIIDLRTLRRPNEPFMTFKLGTSGNTETSFQPGFFVRGSGTDWLGADFGLRRFPAALRTAVADNRRINDTNYAPSALEAFGESLANSPLTVLQTGDLPMDFEGEFTVGNAFDVGDFQVGIVGVLGYSSEFKTRDAQRSEVFGSVVETQGRNVSSSWDVVANAFGSASIGWGENELIFTGLLVRSSSKDAQVYVGTDINLPTGQSERTESSAWYERQLTSGQIAGEHMLGGLEVKWRAALARSTRDAPYERDVGYSVVGGVASFQGANLGNSTRFSSLNDDIVSGGVDLSYTFDLTPERELVLSGGLFASSTERVYELLTFAFTGPRTPTPNNVLQARVDFLFSPDNIDPRRFVLNEFTGRDDAYQGTFDNLAFYMAAEVDVTSFIRASVGVRYEDGQLAVATGNRFGEAASAPVSLDNTYWLPAATVTWNFADDLQLRLGYSQTIARPQFRELAFTPFIDPDTDRIYQGNPFLTDSEFQNVDARLEYYFGRGQFVTLGGFYKIIENPIEEVIVRLERTLTRFINAPEATLYGAEFEYRTNFEMPFELPVLADATWLFAVNYTWTKSEVSAPAGSTVISPIDFRRVSAAQFALDGSVLQGTPEHIANLQFGWQTDTSEMTLLAGWVSERVLQRGLGALPSVIDEPGVNLDLTFRHDLQLAGQNLTLGLSARNLLDTEHREFQTSALGETPTNTYARGRSFSISLTMRR